MMQFMCFQIFDIWHFNALIAIILVLNPVGSSVLGPGLEKQKVQCSNCNEKIELYILQQHRESCGKGVTGQGKCCYVHLVIILTNI